MKPDTSRDNQVSKGEKLGLKGIIISILCGLPIGFGTGFVGTGGGMMMLIVFTVFLWMELKTSVGTSTFIMTFTALIASISHILIHPAIVTEKWDIMLLCIVVATVSSLASARFANRVKNRTIGLVTGAVLTLLGAAMLVLYFWDYLSGVELFVQTLRCIGLLILFIVPSAIVLLLIRAFVKPPRYVFRKLLHFVAVSAIAAMGILADNWLAAVLSSVVFILILYPTLKIHEREPWFENFFSQKEPGEILKSMFLFLGMSALLVAVGWGIFGQRILAATSILMWGAGDGSAALIGIPFAIEAVLLLLNSLL